MNEDKIIQIMPTPPGLFAKYRDNKGEFTSPIVCLALTSEGEVVMMDTDSRGEIGEVGSGNFRGIKWADE